MIRGVIIGSVLWLTACSDSKGEGGDASAPAGGSQARLEPGEWEVAMETVNPEGAPLDLEAVMAGKGTEEEVTKSILGAIRTVERQCITPQKAAELFTDVEEGCKREGEGWRNGRIATRLICTQSDTPQTSVHEVSGAYSARSFDVTQKLSETWDGDTTTTEIRTTGRRIGDCAAGKSNLTTKGESQ